MWGRRGIYLAALLGGLVFFGVYREWISWILLWVIVCLPWFSLALSLPAMLTAKVSVRCPEKVQQGDSVRTALRVDCRFPVPEVKSKLRLQNLTTGERYAGWMGEQVPTQRCGCIVLSWDKIVIYDYLGLFRRTLKGGQGGEIYVFPKTVKSQLPPPKPDGLVHSWKPKPGGSFSENRELRLYRPGDSLRHIHWKLTAKVGKPIYAEPIEPVQQGYVLTLCLCGDWEDKLGRLLYVSGCLLAQEISHRAQCKTADGTVEFLVTDKATLDQGVCLILRQKPSDCEVEMPVTGVLWHHHIGGDGHEA